MAVTPASIRRVGCGARAGVGRLQDTALMLLGIVDAHVMAIAERMNITKIASIDHGNFRAVKLRHCDGLELLPS
jgi:hypothetical protein